MKHLIPTIIFSFSTILCFSQVESKKESDIKISSRHTGSKKIVTKPVLETKKELNKPERIILNSSQPEKKYDEPKKASRISDNIIKDEINIETKSENSDLENTLLLIEEKENIHKYNNSLAQTPKYQDLLKEISIYKNSFSKSVDLKGIENCSLKEQNYYLSFLKEENKKEEYKTAISKIK